MYTRLLSVGSGDIAWRAMIAIADVVEKQAREKVDLTVHSHPASLKLKCLKTRIFASGGRSQGSGSSLHVVAIDELRADVCSGSKSRNLHRLAMLSFLDVSWFFAD